MVFNCKFFYADVQQEALLPPVGNKQWKPTKNESKKAASDGGKKNAPKPADQAKFAVKPIEKSGQPSDIGTERKRSIEERERPESQQFSLDDDKQRPPSKVTAIPHMGGNDNGNGDNSKKLNKRTSTLVLKMRFHCEDCVHKVRRAVKKLEGVGTVALDAETGLITVTGTLETEKLISYLEQKVKQAIEVVFQARLNNDEESVAIPDRNDIRLQNAKVSADYNITGTLNLRIKLHCGRCIEKIRVAITQCRGVDLVDFHEKSDLVMVAGKLDSRELVSYLRNKLRRKVEVVVPVEESADERNHGVLPPAHSIDPEKDVSASYNRSSHHVHYSGSSSGGHRRLYQNRAIDMYTFMSHDENDSAPSIMFGGPICWKIWVLPWALV